jgi:acyl carrier protein
MPNTLGLDDDLDPVEVVQLLERVFDIEVSQEEADRISTVGDFYEVLLRKIPPDEADRKCASAVAFYRIRAALRRLGHGDRLTPASGMHVLERAMAMTTSGRI